MADKIRLLAFWSVFWTPRVFSGLKFHVLAITTVWIDKCQNIQQRLQFNNTLWSNRCDWGDVMRIFSDYVNFTWTLWDTKLIDSALWNEMLGVVGWYEWCGDVVGCCWVVWRCCGFLLSCYGVIMLKILKSGDLLTDFLCDKSSPQY